MQGHTTDTIEATAEQVQHLWRHLTSAQRELSLALDVPGGTMRSLDELGARLGRTKRSVVGVLNGLGRTSKHVFPDEFNVQGLHQPGQSTYTIVLFHEERSEHPEFIGMWLLGRCPALHAFMVDRGIL